MSIIDGKPYDPEKISFGINVGKYKFELSVE